jgi:hypothetical protein
MDDANGESAAALMEASHAEEARWRERQQVSEREREMTDAAIAAALAQLEAGSNSTASSSSGERGQTDSNSQDECITCLSREANACLIPCGHITVCMKCVLKIHPRQCPMCRINFTGVAEVVKRKRR